MKISEASRPFLFQKRPDSQLTRGRRAAFWLWNILILLCAAAGVTGVMLLLAPGPYALSVFVGYFTHPVLFLLNLLPVALLMALGWAATGRPWAAYPGADGADVPARPVQQAALDENVVFAARKGHGQCFHEKASSSGENRRKSWGAVSEKGDTLTPFPCPSGTPADGPCP